jgi:hypothetical protein
LIIFNAYKMRINKERNNKCWDCNAEPDDALTNNSFLDKVVKNEDNWKSFKKMCQDIMKHRHKRKIDIDIASKAIKR